MLASALAGRPLSVTRGDQVNAADPRDSGGTPAAIARDMTEISTNALARIVGGAPRSAQCTSAEDAAHRATEAARDVITKPPGAFGGVAKFFRDRRANKSASDAWAAADAACGGAGAAR